MIVPYRHFTTIHWVDENDAGVTLCFKPSRGMTRVRKMPGVIAAMAEASPLGSMCEGCREMAIGPRFAFCENVMATGTSVIHIRILTQRGLRLSGGADTPALCGREVAWDLPGRVDEASAADGRTCRPCLGIWREALRLIV